jgi:hypothetical protein
LQLDVRDEARHKEEIERPFAEDVVGEPSSVDFDVLRPWSHAANARGRGMASRQGEDLIFAEKIRVNARREAAPVGPILRSMSTNARGTTCHTAYRSRALLVALVVILAGLGASYAALSARSASADPTVGQSVNDGA